MYNNDYQKYAKKKITVFLVQQNKKALKTIGLIGGLTWHSTLDYYRLLNELTNKELGDDHAAKIIVNSVDFAEIKGLTEKQDWDGIAVIICDAAKTIEKAGAHYLMIGANTMHNIADKVQASVSIPVIHIADAVAAAINIKGLKKVALLGTKYTMQMDFYKTRLCFKINRRRNPRDGQRALVHLVAGNGFEQFLFGNENMNLFRARTQEGFEFDQPFWRDERGHDGEAAGEQAAHGFVIGGHEDAGALMFVHAPKREIDGQLGRSERFHRFNL